MAALLCEVVLSSFRDPEQDNHFCEWHHISDTDLPAIFGLDKSYSPGEVSHAAIYDCIRKTPDGVVLVRPVVLYNWTVPGLRSSTGFSLHDRWMFLLCVRFGDIRVSALGAPENISSNKIVSKVHLGRIYSHYACHARHRT